MQLPLGCAGVQDLDGYFSAEDGRSEGAALNVITKAGTNNLHGALFGFFRSDALQTSSYLTFSPGTPSWRTAASNMVMPLAAHCTGTRNLASSPMKVCESAPAFPSTPDRLRNSPSRLHSALSPRPRSAHHSTRSATTAVSTTNAATRNVSTSPIPPRTTRGRMTNPPTRSTPRKATSRSMT